MLWKNWEGFVDSAEDEVGLSRNFYQWTRVLFHRVSAEFNTGMLHLPSIEH